MTKNHEKYEIFGKKEIVQESLKLLNFLTIHRKYICT